MPIPFAVDGCCHGLDLRVAFAASSLGPLWEFPDMQSQPSNRTGLVPAVLDALAAKMGFAWHPRFKKLTTGAVWMDTLSLTSHITKRVE